MSSLTWARGLPGCLNWSSGNTKLKLHIHFCTQQNTNTNTNLKHKIVTNTKQKLVRSCDVVTYVGLGPEL